MDLDHTTGEPDINLSMIKDFELGVLLERAYARMRELELAQYGISSEQAAILHTLQSQGGSATNDEIANIIIRQYHSVASIISRMEKIGLVKKEQSKKSKKFIISITEKGITQYAGVSRNSICMYFEDLSPEEKLQLANALYKALRKGRKMLGLDDRLPFLMDKPKENNA
jgi:DNA-binding MarR family transcriptional regulator